MSNAALVWRASIDRYYENGLEDFADARTVRIQLRECQTFQAEITRIEAEMTPEQIKDWRQTLGDEFVAVEALRVELAGWLEKRGFTP